MTTENFITDLFYHVDNQMGEVAKHPQSRLWPGEIVTLALLFALKGVGNRAFYRWLLRDWQMLFPQLPSRTRLFRQFATHRDWTEQFLADPTLLGVPRVAAISKRFRASLSSTTRYTCWGSSTPLSMCCPRSSQTK
jgi:hypothetical protein